MSPFTLIIVVILSSICVYGCESRRSEDGSKSSPTVNIEQIPQTNSAEHKQKLSGDKANYLGTVENTKRPFKDPLPPTVYELPSAALATWREYAATKPTLVLFSSHPMLSLVPKESQTEARDLVLAGSAEEISRRGRFAAADTLFLPIHTMSAAIDAGFFSEFIYVHPTTSPLEEFSLESFQSRAVKAGFISEEESSNLTIKDGVISGTLRGLPFRCVHPQSLPKIDGPVILHIDLSYFRELYVNAIKTPIYDQLYQLANSIRNAGWLAQAVTLSYSNQEGDMSLATRFVISNLAEIFSHPGLLEGNTPASWNDRAMALYLEGMFMQSKSREHIAQGAKSNPKDPAALYAQAVVQFQTKHAEKGFSTLNQAVQIDKGYGLEYLSLAKQGIDINQPKKSIELIEKVVRLFPDNPLFRLSQADYLIKTGRGKEALPVLAELRELPWSATFHPEVPGLLQRMESAAKAPPTPLPQAVKKEQRHNAQRPAHSGIPYQ